MPRFGQVTPILRLFDEQMTRDFYIGFLGFEIEFEHRFSDDAPLYIGLRLGNCLIHLSGHFGDSCPGMRIRIPVDDIDAYIGGLAAKNFKYAKPGGGERTPWGSIECTISDPSGNKLTFYQDE